MSSSNSEKITCVTPMSSSGKTMWPEVVGLTAEEAKAIVLKDMPYADVVILPVRSVVTTDFRDSRVRIFANTVVKQTPHVG
uniref:Uncharacterized protein n=1 Tax=Avena sativa TaxID=4498 RepID=A0ACD5W7B2_AVESA